MHRADSSMRLIFIFFALLLLAGCSKSNYAELDGMRFNVEIADTPEERAAGLTFRDSLCKDCGMLFISDDEDYPAFWMKNTLIPLDMVFINSEMEVVDVQHAAPCGTEECLSYIPKEKAKYVLEVNAYNFDETAIGKKLILK
ncbi:MAG: DUF192 domain-containing protein [Candidatus Woesearchaeota archaeon]